MMLSRFKKLSTEDQLTLVEINNLIRKRNLIQKLAVQLRSQKRHPEYNEQRVILSKLDIDIITMMNQNLHIPHAKLIKFN